jgi:hypothetical protein
MTKGWELDSPTFVNGFATLALTRKICLLVSTVTVAGEGPSVCWILLFCKAEPCSFVRLRQNCVVHGIINLYVAA